MPEYELVERLRLTAGEPVTLNAVLTVLRGEDGMIRLREIAQNQFRRQSKAATISGSKGQIEFGGATIEWVVTRQPGIRFRKGQPNCELFDADEVGSSILLRHWRPGDRFQPIGMAKSVKIQDLLVNQKVPKELRKGLIIATTRAGEIFWVEKLRISERFRLHSRTKRRLQWRWRRF
jgi:tRNA(Ile)-lysidine synthetase-like protein